MGALKSLLLISIAALIAITATRLRALFDVDEERIVSSYSRPENAPLVAIVSCVKHKDFQRDADFLETSLLPSIYDTVTGEERAKFRVELILGYDHDDAYWAREEQHRLSPRRRGYRNPDEYYARDEPIPVSYVSIRKNPRGDRPNRIPFNELCRAAFDYGATYIVRINDDTQFSTVGWITEATRALASFDPPHVGVVGPTCHEGNTEIMTHDMVYAPAHYSIFDHYYAEEFDNFYVDDWMSRVYGEERTRKLAAWEVRHHLTKFSTRYEPSFRQDKLLNRSVAEGTRSVEQFVVSERERLTNINSHGFGGYRKGHREELRMLGTDTIDKVDGPMRELHLSLMKRS